MDLLTSLRDDDTGDGERDRAVEGTEVGSGKREERAVEARFA